MQNAKKINIRCYSYKIGKQFYRKNGMRVLTDIVCAKRVARVDRGQRSFVSDGGTLSKHY